MSETSVYLAGPVRDAPDSGRGWREEIERNYGDEYNIVNPLDKYDVPVESLEIVDGYADTGENGVVGTDDIVDEDLGRIVYCDAVLVGYADVGRMVGTPMEVMYARRVREIPVALWVRDETDFTDISPWFRSLATAITNDAELALSHLDRQAPYVEW